MGRSILYALETAFTLWMLVDAAQRRPQYYWYFVILTPFGAWVYFFVVKIHDHDMVWLKRLVGFNRPPTLKELRYRLRTTPSFANRVALADVLADQGEHTEAKELYRQALQNRPNAVDALHGLGYCELRTGENEAAIEHLAQAVDRDFAFREYQAAIDLAEAFEQDGLGEEALELLQRVARSSPRLANELRLAKLQAKLGKVDEARRGLERALEDYEHAPRFVKRRDRPSLGDAQKFWSEINAGSADPG